jgi:small-conductance mechanosensitive channel
MQGAMPVPKTPQQIIETGRASWAWRGPVGFLLRLSLAALVLFVALYVAGIEARALLLGGAFTAVILGLAAQQTLGNVIAGTVLLSARPFKVGDRVRLQGGPLAGRIEGEVSAHGLLYTTFATADGPVLVPNSVVLNVSIMSHETPPEGEGAQPPARTS